VADRAYIVNTDTKHSPLVHEQMLSEGKASACFDPWKYKIERIAKDDVVFLYHSGVGIVAFGIATGRLEKSAYPDDPRYRDDVYSARLKPFTVLDQPLTAARIREITGTNYRFMQTLFEIPAEHASQLLEEVRRERGQQPAETMPLKRKRPRKTASNPVSQPPREAVIEQELERMMEAGEPIHGRRLRMVGRQMVLEGCGRLDLLAEDLDSGDLVVIEVKRGLGSDQVVGQITRYMGWVKKHLANDRKVRGTIVASAADERLVYSVQNVPDVTILTYTDHGLTFREIR
jgi:hypothetical protein